MSIVCVREECPSSDWTTFGCSRLNNRAVARVCRNVWKVKPSLASPVRARSGLGILDKAKGKAKEATGAVTGDEAEKSEGQKDQTKGTAKDKLGKAKDLLK